MTKKLPPILGAVPMPATLTPAESEFMTKLRTLCPDALRTLMPVFNAMYDYSNEKAGKARPVLRLIQGGQS
jgi:hypothetical protein